MRLIRITTDDELGVFETKFNEDIVIEPESQIALSNASFDTVFKTLTIDASNDTIQYRIRKGNQFLKDVVLDHGIYTSSEEDSQNLMNQIQNRFNEALENTGGEIGTSFLVSNTDINHPTQGLVSFQVRRSSYALKEADYTLVNQIDISKSDGASRRAIFQNSGGTVNDDSMKLISINHFSLGCAIARCKIRALVDNSSTQNGFRMYLTQLEEDVMRTKDTVAVGDTEVYLQVAPIDGGANSGTFRYKTSVGGAALVDSNKNVLSHAIKAGGDPINDGAGDVADANNDVVEFRQVGGQIKIVVYRNGESAEEVLATHTYNYETDTNKRLYFGLSVQGTKSHTSVESLRVNYDPFENTNKTYELEYGEDALEGVGLPPFQPQQRIAPTEFAIKFPTTDLRDFLGFVDRNITVDLVNEAIIQSKFLFTANLFNDSYLFELLNIDLESYDSFSNGKRNILKVIPSADTGHSVIDYESSNLTFINIRNKFPLTLRNLKGRLLRNDLTPIVVRGLSVVTLLLRDKGERL